jgi:8-oxo-dGTP pyrophosphatase MutT (NUDIX family)
MAVAALTTALWAGGCGSVGGVAETTQGDGSYSVAQLIVLRGEGQAQRLEVLLTRNSPNAFFSPNAWVLPSGAVESDKGGEEAARTAAVQALAQQGGIKVSDAELVPYAHWIVPGFDTIYYLALAPRHSMPRPDGTETVDAGWFEPRRALAMRRAGDLPMDYLTIKQLESLIGFATTANALKTTSAGEVQPVHLEIVGEGDKERAVLPEDAPRD